MDIINSSILRAQYTAPRYTGIKRRYKEFCSLNGLSTENGLEPWVGQMLTDGLTPGSIDTYTQTVVRCSPELIHHSEAKRILAATAAFHSHFGGRGHAQDITDDAARKIVRQASALTPSLADQLWLMYTTGLRASCIDRLQGDSIKLTATSLILCIRFTKGVRRTRKRRQVIFPLKGLPKPPKSLTKTLRKNNSKRVLFPVTAAKLNEVLKAACKKLKLKCITSGTFRRLFSMRIAKHCEDNNIPKSDMMVHASSDMDRAFYGFDTLP